MRGGMHGGCSAAFFDPGAAAVARSAGGGRRRSSSLVTSPAILYLSLSLPLAPRNAQTVLLVGSTAATAAAVASAVGLGNSLGVAGDRFGYYLWVDCARSTPQVAAANLPTQSSPNP